MIDIQEHIDKLELLKEYMNCWIELKFWMLQPLKPFPYKAQQRIMEINNTGK